MAQAFPNCSSQPCPRCKEDWADLPLDLVSNVCARLPLHSLFRARTACKNWALSLPSGGTFLRAHAQVAAAECYFPVVVSRGASVRCCALDPSSRTWREMPPFSCLPKLFLPSKDDYQVLAGHKGLFFVRNSRYYFVCNPLTKACMQLPPVYGGGLPFFSGAVSLQVDPSRNSYRVHMFMDHPLGGKWAQTALPLDSGYVDNGFVRVQVYDSMTRSWSLLTSGPTFDKAVVASTNLTHCDGTFFLVVRNSYDHKLWMASFNLQAREWTNYRMPGGVRERMGNLVHYEGKVLLVGWNFDLGRYLVIYVLIPSSDEWTIITFMPPYMEDVLTLCEKEGIRVVRHAHLLCITTLESLLVVAYDLRTSSWHRWPTPDNRSWVRGTQSGQSVQPLSFPYEPSFASQV